MSFKLGIENEESGSKFILEYMNKRYTEKFSKIMGIDELNDPMRANVVISRSSYFLKYGINLKNLLFFKILEDIWTTNLEISSKKKVIKLIHFDILPAIKFTTVSTNIPLTFFFKYANYRGSGDQQFADYDYSQILKSLLPYDRLGLGFKYEDAIDLSIKSHLIKNNNSKIDEEQTKLRTEISGLNNLLLYKLKLKFNKICNYEDSIKVGVSSKYIKDINFLNQFTLAFQNELHLKNSLIFNSIGTGKVLDSNNNVNIGSYNISSEDTLVINPHHILSANEVISRILGINVMGSQKEINVGQKFYLSNNFQVKLKDIKLIKDYQILSFIEPFFSFETIFVPVLDRGTSSRKHIPIYKNINMNDSFKFISSFGFGLKINDNIAIDFTLKTFTKGVNNVESSVLDKFRMNMNFTTTF